MDLCTTSGVLGMNGTTEYWEYANNKNIEAQLMKRFLLAFSLNHSVEFSHSFALLCVSKSQVTGSVRETIDRSSMGIHFPKQYQHCVLASSDKTVL